eukprot:g17948.t1
MEPSIWGPKAPKDPGLRVEFYNGKAYYQFPFLYVSMSCEQVLQMHLHQDNTAGIALKPSDIKGAAIRLLEKCNGETGKMHKEMVYRSLAGHSYVKDASTFLNIIQTDTSRASAFPDLITGKGLLLLFKQKLIGLSYHKDKAVRPAMCKIYGQIFQNVMAEVGQMGTQMAITPTGIKYNGFISYDQLSGLYRQGYFDYAALGAYRNGLPACEIWELYLMYGLDSDGILSQTLDHLALAFLMGNIFPKTDRYCMEKISWEELGDAGSDRRSSVSQSVRSATSVTQQKKTGRPANSFCQHIKALNDPNATDVAKSSARMHLLHGHYLTLKGIQLLSAWSKLPIGFATDDQCVAGKDWATNYLRGHFFSTPIVEGYTPTTLCTMPMCMPRVNMQEQETITRRMADFYVDTEDKEALRASLKYAALLGKNSDLISMGRLAIDRLLLHMSDMGPSQRKFPRYLMCDGFDCLAFFDTPHTQSNTMLHIAKNVLDPLIARFLQTRSTAGGSQSVKISDILMNFTKMSDESCVKGIGDRRDALMDELKPSTFEMEDLVMAFKVQCRKLCAEFSSINNKKFGKYHYAALSLFENWSTMETGITMVYNKEKNRLAPIVAARAEVVENENCEFSRLQYKMEDLNELCAQLVKMPKSDTAMGAREIFVDDPFPIEEPADVFPAAVGENTAMPPIPEGGDKQNDLFDEPEEDDLLGGDAHGPENRDGAEFAGDTNATTKRKGKKAAADNIFLDEDMGSLIVSLYYFFTNPASRMRTFVFFHCSGPILLGHSLQIGLDHTNFMSRGMSYHLPTVILAEIGDRMRAALPRSVRELASECPDFPKWFGKTIIESVAGGVRLQMSGLMQYQRLHMYGCRQVLDNPVSKLMEEAKEMKQSLKWILDHPQKFSRHPDLFGLAEDREFVPTYCADISNPNNMLVGTYAEQKYVENATNFASTKRAPVYEWEVAIADRTRKIWLEKSYRPALKFSAFLLDQPNYKPTNRMIEYLRKGELGTFVDQATLEQSCKIPSARNLEAGGTKYAPQSRKANATGVMTDGMPLYLAQVNVPGWIPWLDPCQPEDIETYDVNGLDAEGRGFMKKRHCPKGRMMSFSVLDGRAPSDETAAEIRKQYWTARTLEDFVPRVSPGHMDEAVDTIKNAIQAETAKQPDVEDELRCAAYDLFIDQEKSRPGATPSYNVLRKQLSQSMKVDRADTFLTPEQEERMAKHKYNIEHIPKMLVSEAIAFEYADEFAVMERKVLGESGPIVSTILRRRKPAARFFDLENAARKVRRNQEAHAP